MILLDTNVISELVRPSPSSIVMKWIEVQPPFEFATSSVVEAEIKYGIASMPNGKKREFLASKIDELFGHLFVERVFPFERDAARYFAEFVAHRRTIGRPLNTFDAMIAATAAATGSALATRDTSDFADLDLKLINPWDFSP